MKTTLVLLSLLCASGCSTANNAWRRLYLSGPACVSFETIVVRGQSFHVSRIAGEVYFSHGPVPDVSITLRKLGESDSLGTVTSDANGAFTFPEMPDGWYQLATCKDGWNAVVAPVRVTRRGEGSIRLTVSLAT
jgi:hypothetical protein